MKSLSELLAMGDEQLNSIAASLTSSETKSSSSITCLEGGEQLAFGI
jgi:hypothetical protein